MESRTGEPVSAEEMAVAGAKDAQARRKGRRGETLIVAFGLLTGLLGGVAWYLLGDPVAHAGEAAEQVAAYDVVFTLLALAGGLLTGIAAHLLPTTGPVRRFVAGLVAGVIGGLVAWGVGNLLGSPGLRAKGAVVLWPLVVSAVFFAVNLTSLIRRGAPVEPPAPR